MKFLKFPTVLADLPWEELRTAYDALLAAGEHPSEASKAVAQLVDDLVDWTDVVKGPGGLVLEAADRPLVRLAVSLGLRWTSRGVTG